MYTPIFWKNHIVEFMHRFAMTQGESPGLVYLKPAPGEIDQQGTPQSAENFNKMDAGILEQALMTNMLFITTKHEAEQVAGMEEDINAIYKKSTEYTDKRFTDFISIGPDEPENTPVVWFKTIKSVDTEQLTKMLQLGDDEDASAVAVKVDDVNYSVLNITEAKVENDNIVLTIT